MARLLPGFYTRVRRGDLVRRIDAVDHRPFSAGLGQLLEDEQVFRFLAGRAQPGLPFQAPEEAAAMAEVFPR